MGEFFQGWRRKAGLVTLAMACVLTAAWMRSYTAIDEIFIPRLRSHHFVGSFAGGFYWERWPGSMSLEVWPEFGSDYKGLISGSVHFAEQLPWFSAADAESRRDWAGFHFGAVVYETTPSITSRVEWWFFPYWSLVLPLTLLSAWLILGKSRKATPAKESSRG